MFNEISQRKTNIVWYQSYVESKQMKYEYNKTETDSQTENTHIVIEGRGKEGRIR